MFGNINFNIEFRRELKIHIIQVRDRDDNGEVLVDTEITRPGISIGFVHLGATGETVRQQFRKGGTYGPWCKYPSGYAADIYEVGALDAALQRRKWDQAPLNDLANTEL